MSLLRLPELSAPHGRQVKFHLSPQALEKWQPALQASAETDNTISVLDVIGQDFWTGEGVTAKRISAALRSIGPDAPVTVNVNSPGGDMFEGTAIYNLLREHRGHVKVKVLGMAASAASIIVMAGDEIQIGRPSFFMIHNAWVVAAGNRHEFKEISEWMEPFDAAMADVYAARTGLPAGDIAKMMDRETWIGGSSAVDKGFADSLLESDSVKEGESKAQAASVRRVEAVLRASGMPRSEAQKLISDFKSSLSDSAGASGLSDSAADLAASLRILKSTLKV
jgi:ATP-dependent Clp protease protease subunit